MRSMLASIQNELPVIDVSCLWNGGPDKALIALGDNSPDLDEEYRKLGSAAGFNRSGRTRANRRHHTISSKLHVSGIGQSSQLMIAWPKEDFELEMRVVAVWHGCSGPTNRLRAL